VSLRKELNGRRVNVSLYEAYESKEEAVEKFVGRCRAFLGCRRGRKREESEDPTLLSFGTLSYDKRETRRAIPLEEDGDQR
jgi:hypothetical protein